MGMRGERMGIIGGNGRMGSWFAGLLEAQGVEVLRTGRSAKVSPREMARHCNVIVVSVPIAATMEVIREVGPLVPEDGLLMDLTSIKKLPLDAMLRYSRSQVVGLHPLFGPAPEGKDLSVVVCPGRGHEGLEWITSVFRKGGIRVISLGPEAHDRLMGIIQGATHFATLALALSIERSGYAMKELLDCSTPTFRLYLDRIRNMLEQPSGLFGSLLMDNSFTEKHLKIYRRSCEQLEQITRDGDREEFEKLFDSLTEFFCMEENKS